MAKCDGLGPGFERWFSGGRLQPMRFVRNLIWGAIWAGLRFRFGQQQTMGIGVFHCGYRLLDDKGDFLVASAGLGVAR